MTWIPRLGCVLACVAGCHRAAPSGPPTASGVPAPIAPLTDPLPSWNAGENKTLLLDFVDRVTDPNSPDFVEPRIRVATIDMDGTLWTERPRFFQYLFSKPILIGKIENDPTLADVQPYKAVCEDDFDWFYANADYYKPGGLFSIMTQTHLGEVQGSFADDARAFLFDTDHVDFRVPHADLVYVPMAEVIRHLQASGFAVFIVSGSEAEFIRPVAEAKLGLNPWSVIGTRVMLEFQHEEANSLVRRDEFSAPICDTDYKPVNIKLLTGRRPILAIGNSTGDTAMLQYSDDGDPSTPDLQMLVNHDDPDREYCYSVDTVQDLADRHGWAVISMKRDFEQIFEKPWGTMSAVERTCETVSDEKHECSVAK